MEAVLDIVAGTGVVLFLLATAFIGSFRGRLLAFTLVAAGAWFLHPFAVRQSLSSLIGGLDAGGLQALAAVLTLDGVLGSFGAARLLRVRDGAPIPRLRGLAAHYIGLSPVPALLYLEMKAFDASSWSFGTTALALCLTIVAAGLAGSELLRRVLPDRDVRIELRLLVHVGQVALAAALTAFALGGAARSNSMAPEAGPHAVVAGAVVGGILIGAWIHRRRQRRMAG